MMAKVLRLLISVVKLMTAKIQAAKVAKNESTPFFKLYFRHVYLEVFNTQVGALPNSIPHSFAFEGSSFQ